MTCHTDYVCVTVRRATSVTACLLLALLVFGSCSASAQSYISAEPIPSTEVVGTDKLDKMLGLGYENLEIWSQRLLRQCGMVQSVIDTLTNYRAITTINGANSAAIVAAGGFEGITDPTFVVTIENKGQLAAAPGDIFVLNNALGYVLSQSGTAQFSLPSDNQQKHNVEFPLDYAVVTFAEGLKGEDAKRFFDDLGKIDPALWSGTNAGFTQVNVSDDPVRQYTMDNSMLFLIGSVSKREFIEGISTLAARTPGATYSPLTNGGKAATAKAGAAFPANDWTAFPGGDQYLTALGSAPTGLLTSLKELRQKHRHAVDALVQAIDSRTVDTYLSSQFSCPR